MLFSIIPGMRAARRIGAAERMERRGDLHGSVRARLEALEILGRPDVDLEMPWCRAGATVALSGYAYTAHKLGLWRELLETLTRWRPMYSRWKDAPTDTDEARYLKWFDEVLDSRAG